MKHIYSSKIIFLVVTVILITSLRANSNLFFTQNYVEYLNSIQNKRVTESQSLYKTASYYYLNDYDAVINYSKEYLTINHKSILKDYHLFYQALSLFNLGRQEKCIELLINLKSSRYEDLVENSEILIKEIVKKSLNKKQLISISDKIKDMTLFKNLERNNNEFNILVVLPLTGINSEPGKELLRGIKFAYSQSLKNSDIKINLNVLNSESSNSIMQMKVLNFFKTRYTDLVIGELESGMSAALAGICTIKRIPLIIPVATERNLANIGNNIYQLNVSSYQLGQKIADYAAGQKKQRVFATLAPMTREGQEAVNGFIDRISQYGGVILTQEWYYDALNIERQLTRIREQVLLADSLNVKENMEYDSIKTKKVGVIEGLFLPINNSSEIESISSQTTFYNFKASRYGTFGWNSLVNLNKFKQNSDSIIFITENSYDINNETYLKLTEDFRNKYHKSMEKLELIGYDTYNFIYGSFIKSIRNGKKLNQNLAETNFYNGVNGEIIFSKDKKANQSTKLYQFLRRSNKLKNISDTRSLAAYYPPNVESRNLNLAEAFFKLKQYPKAIEIYKYQFKKDTTKINYLYTIATGYRKMHEYDSLLTVSNYILKRDSTNQQSKFDIAYSFLRKDSLDIAEKCYLELDSVLEGYNSEIKYHLGEVYDSKLDFEKSAKYYIQAKEINSDIKFIDYIIGMAYLNNDLQKESIPYFILSAKKGIIEARDFLRSEQIPWSDDE